MMFLNLKYDSYFSTWEIFILAGIILVITTGSIAYLFARQRKNKTINRSIEDLKKQIEDAEMALRSNSVDPGRKNNNQNYIKQDN